MALKKIFNWQVVLGIVLIMLSASVYYVHFLIFRDARHIFIYLIGDIVFVFLEVFLVTLVIHNLLLDRVFYHKHYLLLVSFFYVSWLVFYLSSSGHQHHTNPLQCIDGRPLCLFFTYGLCHRGQRTPLPLARTLRNNLYGHRLCPLCFHRHTN